MDFICSACGNEFKDAKHKGRKYCSKECSYKRPNQGGYRPGSVRNFNSGWYISKISDKIWLDSSYEFIMAEYLDSKNYQWIKNYQGFAYINSKGEQRKYIPDF